MLSTYSFLVSYDIDFSHGHYIQPYLIISIWGRAARGKNKNSCIYACGITLVVSNSVSYGLWPPRLLCQGDSPGKSAGLGCHTFLEHCFLLPQLPNPLSTWCCQGHTSPCSRTTSTPGPLWGRPESSRAASRTNPSGRPTCRGRYKTALETQGQCGCPRTFPPAVQAPGQIHMIIQADSVSMEYIKRHGALPQKKTHQC